MSAAVSWRSLALRASAVRKNATSVSATAGSNMPGLDGRLVADRRGIGQPVAEPRGRSGRHLEEHHRGRVSLGGRVVPPAFRCVEERVQVGRRARRHGGRAGAGQGEVEEHEVLCPVAAALPDAEVGGLDVPVVDPGPVQGDQRLQQVGAPPFQQVQGQPLAAAQHLAQRLVAGALQHQGLPAADVERAFDQPHQPRAGQPGQHLGLVGDPRGRGVVDRDLEHPGGVRARVGDSQVGDQQADGGGPGAEAAFEPEPAVDDRAGGCLQRVDDLLGRAGQRPAPRRPAVPGRTGRPAAARSPRAGSPPAPAPGPRTAPAAGQPPGPGRRPGAAARAAPHGPQRPGGRPARSRPGRRGRTRPAGSGRRRGSTRLRVPGKPRPAAGPRPRHPGASPRSAGQPPGWRHQRRPSGR